MKQKRLIESEEDIQQLIFDYPWLLDINFERLASSAITDGWEVQLRTGSRLDILFRDRMDGSPVIVEFKKGEFYRENIGQLIDYRASVLREIYDPQSTLSGVFGNRLFQPILCLVVKKCDDFARSACALAGIRVFEYQNNLEELRHVGNTRILKDIGDVLKEDVIPL